MSTWTPAILKQLQKDGKIRGYHIHAQKKCKDTSPKMPAKKSKEKDWLNWNLPFWANEKGLELKEEFVFHQDRKWRFDWCFPVLMVAIEYEGIMGKKSRHTTIKGYSGDVEKYNAAQALGWRIIRLTAIDYKSVLQKLNDYANTKNVRQ